jgi:hypothetical protein
LTLSEPDDGYLTLSEPDDGYLTLSEPDDGYLTLSEPDDGYSMHTKLDIYIFSKKFKRVFIAVMV